MTFRQEDTVSRCCEAAGDTQRVVGTGFRPDVEGLRAVAVLAVVCYHADLPGATGGFTGVDVFFVISGFLITGLLWREVIASNTVRLSRFYGSRARRLLPAAATVGVVTAIIAAVVLPPLQARNVLVDGIASAVYVGNYRFAVQGTDYLGADFGPSPFQHYWSLGVEEQFYLVWPVLIIGTAWLVRRGRRGRLVQSGATATPFAIVLTLVAAASLATAVIWTHTSPPSARLGASRRRSGRALDPPMEAAAKTARGDRRMGRLGADPADLHAAGLAHPLPGYGSPATRTRHHPGHRRR